MYGEQVFGLAAVVAEFFAELHDHLVQRARGAIVVVTPDFIEQPVARQHLAGMGMEKLEKLEFARGEIVDSSML
jgi:hypothetical protein